MFYWNSYTANKTEKIASGKWFLRKKNSYSFWQCVFDWGVSILFHLFQFPFFPFGYTSTPCVPFLLSRNTRVDTYHLHAKTENSGLKIKWFSPLRLGSLWFEAMQFFWSCWPVQLKRLFFVAGHSPTRSNFIVLCLCTRYPAGWKKW